MPRSDFVRPLDVYAVLAHYRHRHTIATEGDKTRMYYYLSLQELTELCNEVLREHALWIQPTKSAGPPRSSGNNL
jgi:hypothetical protein